MKLTPSHETFTKGNYKLSVDGNPGALELSYTNGDIRARIYAVSPRLTGYVSNRLNGSSANAFIMEKCCIIYGKELKLEARKNLVYSQLISLMWNFCVENELELSPIEFDLIGFINLWFKG